MKINVSSVSFISISKNNIIPENWPKSSKEIKTHGKFLGCIRTIFGSDVRLKDSSRIWYVDKKSLRSWAEAHGVPKGIQLKNLETELAKIKKPPEEAKPTYADLVMNDPKISKNSKDLFHLLFVDIFNLEILRNSQPLGSQLTVIKKRLEDFNKAHGTALGCLKTAHSDRLDPWQTIKITDPTMTQIGKVSPLLSELNQVLFEKWGIQSGGGDDGNVEHGKQKNTPQCFQNKKGEIIYPQLLLTLIDFKRVLGVIPDKDAYLLALKEAYLT